MTDIQPNKIQLRFKQVRTDLNLNQVQFANLTTIKQSHVSAIERGVKNITGGILILLEDTIGINRKWLETGDGERFIQKGSIVIDKKIINKRLEVKNEGITLDTPIPKPKTMLILEEESPDLGDLKIILPPQKAIPIYNTEFYQITEDNKIEYLPTQNWTSNSIYLGCDAIIRNNGEGMAPIIGDGYLMGIKRVDKDLYFSQGSIYTLITLSGFKLTKYVWKGIREDSFRIHGANDTHPEEEISKNEILSMWHVRVTTPSGLPKMFD